MNAEQLRERQTPLKEKYRSDPASATVQFRSSARLDPAAISCQVNTFAGRVESGLHPAAGGPDGTACSGDMLLDALVACAGVTLQAVATAMGVELRSGTVSAEAAFDFRGTLGVDRDVPVGLTAVRLHFDLDTDAEEEQLDKLIKLTERFCVIYQTLQQTPQITAGWRRANT